MAILGWVTIGGYLYGSLQCGVVLDSFKVLITCFVTIGFSVVAYLEIQGKQD